MKSFYIIIFLFFTPYIYIQAQNYELKLMSTDSILNKQLKYLNFQKKHKSKKSIEMSCDSISKKLTLKGYFDNYYVLHQKDSLITSEYYFSKKVESVLIYFKNEELVKQVLNENFIQHTNNSFKIPIEETQFLLENIISNYEENGFSFTSIKLSKQNYKEQILSAELTINNLKKRAINNLVVKGYYEFSKKKLLKILELEENTVFNSSALKKIENKIKESNLFTSIKKPEVLFSKDSTELYVYLKKQNNSKLDGLVAFSNENENLELSGYLNLTLSNVFNKAEEISIDWIGNSEQKTLNLDYYTPYVFNTNFNIKGNFSLIRKDSTYVNVNPSFSIGYHISNNINISGILNYEDSQVSEDNTNSNYIDYSKTMYGLSLKYFIYNENHNSNTKFNIDASALTGNRKDNSNTTNQQIFNLNASYLLKVNSKNYILLKSINSFINSDDTFENEEYIIGGFSTLRGFDEESIVTPQYSVNTIEYEYLTNNLSYLYSFLDYGIIKDTSQSSDSKLYGFGVGYKFNTSSSVFNIAYALGKYENSPLKLQNSKVHIKITYNF